MIDNEVLRLFAANESGELNDEERARLATEILKNEELFDAFATEQLLLAALSDPVVGQRIEASLRLRKTRFAVSRFRLAFSFACVAMLTVAIGAFFFARLQSNSGTRLDTNNLGKSAQTRGPSSQAMSGSKVAPPVPIYPSVVTKAGSPTHAETLLATILLFPSSRGQSNQTLHIHSYTKTLRLVVEVEAQPFRRYDAEVADADGQSPLLLAGQPNVSGNQVSFSLPEHQLSEGEYVLKLSRQTSDGETEVIDGYAFRVVRDKRTKK